jgi:chloramphenicol-sensitive protein RarD
MSLDYRRGLAMAAGSFVLWGLMPLYWHLLKAVPSLQIIAHRIVWSALMVIGWLCWQRGAGWWRAVAAAPRLAGLLALSAGLIAFNWGLYIWAVNAGHVVETSLGYFVNPLLNVVLGVLFLRERLNPRQWTSVALAALGVAWLTWQYGHPPWIAISLALSFALYGLVRKLAAVDSIPGMGVESSYLFLPALALLFWGETHGAGGFIGNGAAGGWGWRLDLLLVFGGALTALPLIGFAFAVRRVPLSIVGLMQYIAPTLQLACGVLVFGEPFGPERALGFGLIWIALALFAGDGLARSRRSRATALDASGAA